MAVILGDSKMSEIIRLFLSRVKVWFLMGVFLMPLLMPLSSLANQDFPVYQQLGSVAFTLPSTLGVSGLGLPDLGVSDESSQYHGHGLERFYGQVQLLLFGFTHCPKVCPLAIQKMAQVRRQLPNPKHLQLVMVSVDAERDSVVRMREFLGHFDAGIVGFTGTDEQLKAVAKDFAATFFPAADAHDISHTDRLYLIDQRGQVRHLYDPSVPVADILGGVKTLLAENTGAATSNNRWLPGWLQRFLQ